MNPHFGRGASPRPEAGRPVREERAALCDALAEAGPGAPTECAGWTAADLAAHLVVREARPDALPGILLPFLAFHTERVRRRAVRTITFEELVDRIRRGPPKWSPYAVPVVDKNANAVEFFVHHEDVRRARRDWEPRTLSPALEDLLWRRIKIACFALRKVPVEVTLIRPDGGTARVSSGRGRRTPGGTAGRAPGPGRTGPRAGSGGAVRVHGPVGELVLWALGRADVARVRLTGSPRALDILQETGRRL
ncbi:TIGR03085 family metal-binding protein [Spirillospora sp. CA-255316]